MDRNDQQAIEALFGKIAAVERQSPPRDEQAEAFIRERITAQPGSEHYGRLSVLAQWRATAKILFDVNRSAFVPPPSVTSAIVRLEPRAEPLAPDEASTQSVVIGPLSPPGPRRPRRRSRCRC